MISAGYWIGSFKVGAFSLGPVTGALFAGLLVGQFAHVPVSSMTKSFLFLLFLFGVGYSVGPQFMETLKRNGIRPMLLAVVVSATGLAASIAIAKMLGLDPGFAAGLMSGSLTQSAAMGTATDAINGLSLPEAERTRLIAHVAVADAVTYIFGYAGVILFLTAVAPALLKIDLKEEASKLEEALGMTRGKGGLASAWRKFELRAYRLPRGSPSGWSDRCRRGGWRGRAPAVHPQASPGGTDRRGGAGLVLQAGDVIAISGPRQVIVDLVGSRAEEMEDKELLDVPVTAAEVMLTNPKIAGRTLGEASEQDWTRGLYLRSLTRGGEEIPIAPNVVLQRGDLLHVVGPEPVVQTSASRIGALVAPVSTTDFVVLGLAIFLGGVVGVLLTFSIGGIRISLSTSVGTLLAGLLGAICAAVIPCWPYPDGAVPLMTSLGLAAFVGLTGIGTPGRSSFPLSRRPASGCCSANGCGLAPQIGLALGHFVLRMNPILVLAAGGGADGDSGDGCTSIVIGQQPRSSSGLYASVSGCKHPADDMGHGHGGRAGRLDPFR